MAMKPSTSVTAVAFFLFQLLILAAFNISFCNGSSYMGCIESEREALLGFKQDLYDPSNRLASWSADDRDCCTWAGIVCDNRTGHILELNLRNPFNYYIQTQHEANMRSVLVGNINPSLFHFEHLSYLDLSYNEFRGVQIPRFLGSMVNLRYLNLSGSRLVGMVPQQLGNLSNLQYLDLSCNYLYVENDVRWLSGLSFLEHLDMSYVNLSKASDSLLAISRLPSLEKLRLSYCQLHHIPPLPIANFSSLRALSLSYNQFDNSFSSWVFGLNHLLFLDLSYNNIQGPIPDGLQNLTSLTYLVLSVNNFNSSIPNWLYRFNHLECLSLSNNSLQGTISDAVGNLTSISWLDLSFNSLEGRIPRSMSRLCNLRSIILFNNKLNQQISEIFDIFSRCVSDGLEILSLANNSISGHLNEKLGQFKNLDTLVLSANSISGSVPLSLGELSSLRRIDLDYNKLNGTLSQIHFANLTKLKFFFICDNTMTLKVNHDWVPPFQLHILGLRSCYVGSRFPRWLHSQKHLIALDLSNSGLSSTIPSRFWKSVSQFYILDLSQNNIHGEVPNLIKAAQLQYLNLSSNNFSGPLPLVSSSVTALDLSNNAFSGSIFHFLCYGINEPKRIQILILEGNSLHGELPDCWMNYPNLSSLKLSNNKFTGSLPISLGTLSSLQSLHLCRNSLSGTIPMSLTNCRALLTLDVGENEFVGHIPTWIGASFPSMMILILRSNKFHGVLPAQLCSLTFLHVLDLANNNLSGTIPRCINNFSSMVTMDSYTGSAIQSSPLLIGSALSPLYMVVVSEEVSLMMKGKLDDYKNNLNLVRTVDLSDNMLSGEIPTEMTGLRALQTLNLSHNSFTGRIPENIGVMRSLESLDFSANRFSGEIPESIVSLTFLNHLNLSNNTLTGKIPSSTQLQSFDASCFTGNDLCGRPLPKNCIEDNSSPEDKDGEGEGGEVDWFYVSMALGFVVGFWSIIGPLLVNRRWRHGYYHFLGRLGKKVASVRKKT